MTEPPCKGCRASVRLAPDSIRRLLGEYLAERPQPTVGETVVAARLRICRTCPDLLYDTTCKHCGCLVEIRARLAAACCPHPGRPRWQTEPPS